MVSESSEAKKPTKYYVDFENVHGAGLKGVDALGERDEVLVFYSQAAETFHIEHAIDILNSKARVRFVEVDAGTRNAADFQLIVALFADMDEAYDYAVISGDGGFDAAIKMGERMGKPTVRRLGNIAGDEAEPEKPKSRRSRRSRSGRDATKNATEAAEATAAEPAAQEEAAPNAVENPVAEEAPSTGAEAAEHDEVQASEQAGEHKSSSSRRRPRRRKRNGNSAEDQAATQVEAQQSQESPANEADGHAAFDPGEKAATEASADGKVQHAGDAPAVAGVDADAASDETDEAGKPGAGAEEPRQEPENTEEPQSEADASKKPRRRSSKRTSTRKETDDAYARAAEAMRLASHSESAQEAAGAEAQGTETDSETSGTDAPEGKDTAGLVRNLLEQKGVKLSDSQIATVTSALDGSGGRQGFYRRIIKIERQQNGRALYHQVREHYAALIEAIGE